MRNLFIAMGAPGTGKTTWLTAKGLEGNTVSLDQIRGMASVPEECFPGDDPDAYGETHVTLEEHEGFVVEIRDRLLTMRFRQGADVVYEATCPNMRAVGRVMKIARDYGYTITALDFQGNASDADIAARAACRAGTLAYVSPSIALGIAERCRKGRRLIFKNADHFASATWSKGEQRTSQLDRALEKAARLNVIDPGALGFQRVAFIGDIHSESVKLRRLLARIDRSPGGKPLVVFCGDLFDRGPNPFGVFHQVMSLVNEGRAVLIEGNHDTHLREVVIGTAREDYYPDTRVTRNKLVGGGVDKRSIRRLLSRYRLAVAIRFREDSRTVFACHGGVSRSVADLALRTRGAGVSANQLIHGTNSRAKSYRARSDYRDFEEELARGFGDDEGMVLVHGHRNGVTTEGTTRDQWGRTRPAFRRLAVDGVPGVFNLEQGAGHAGGRVAAVVFGPGDKHWVLESD